MEMFAALKKLLFINRVIVQENDWQNVYVLLYRYGVAHEFAKDDLFLRVLANIRPGKSL
eukprot:jgi/Antlo1/866/1977